MEHRKWDAKTKLKIVLEGLKGVTSVSELCSRHQVSQTQYYKWRDQFLNNATKAFEDNDDKECERLRKEAVKLKAMIGSLTVELKKNEFEY